MKVVSISAMPGGPACQSFLLTEYLKGCSGYDAVDIAFADPRDDYLKYPCTINTFNCDEDTSRDVEEWIKSADVFIIHNFDPRVAMQGDPWRPTLPLKLYDKTVGIPLRRDNVIWKLHGSDAVRYALSVHGFEHRHGQLMVGSPDPRIWANAKCINWIPPMMDIKLMEHVMNEWTDKRQLPDYSRKQRFIVNHSATARRKKGSNILTQAMQKLDKKKFYAEITQGASWGESLFYKSVCDVYFDQVYEGMYGVSAIEALLLGKPVICYISHLVKSWLRIHGIWQPFTPAEDAETLAGMIEYVSETPALYDKTFFDKCKLWAVNVHGISTVGEQWRHLIEGVKQ